MKDILVLRELEQIKSIAHPYRLEIIESFEEASATAKQIADRMEEPHAKVNYHIKALVKVGILELIEEKVKLGIVEKYYRPSARNFVIDRNILNTGEKNVLESLEQASISLFETISKDFYKAVELTDEKDHPKKFLCYLDYYMTLDEISELQDKLTIVYEEFLNDKRDKNRPNAKRYSLSSLMIPKVREKK